MSAVCLSVMLSGCVTSDNPPLQRNLPAAPSYVRPVSVSDPKAGDDALVVAARERAGRIQANCVITSFKSWYEGVRTSYSGGKGVSGDACKGRRK